MLKSRVRIASRTRYAAYGHPAVLASFKRQMFFLERLERVTYLLKGKRLTILPQNVRAVKREPNERLVPRCTR